MKRSLPALTVLVLSALVLTTVPALADPGEPRVVQGTLEWPATVSNGPFVVIRGDDGRFYYADIVSAQRRTPDPLTSGTRVAVVGIEGGHPYEIAALAIGAGDASSLGLVIPGASASSPSTPSSPSVIPGVATAPGGSSEALWRLDGTVESVSGASVMLRTENGRLHSVDLSELSEQTVSGLQPGDRVSLFGEPRKDRRLIANGYIQSEIATPAASPRGAPR
jgi:hypothetical protein